MISLETLRRYPFFAQLDESQLKDLAMIAEEVSFEDGEVILKEGKQAAIERLHATRVQLAAAWA